MATKLAWQVNVGIPLGYSGGALCLLEPGEGGVSLDNPLGNVHDFAKCCVLLCLSLGLLGAAGLHFQGLGCKPPFLCLADSLGFLAGGVVGQSMDQFGLDAFQRTACFPVTSVD